MHPRRLLIAALAMLLTFGVIIVACNSDSPNTDDNSNSSTTTSVQNISPNTTSDSTSSTASNAGAQTTPQVTAKPISELKAFGKFGKKSAKLTGRDNVPIQINLLLADTPQLQQEGMMNREDFAGFDGMLFAWNDPVQSKFHMRDVKIPLEIVFYDSNGTYINSTTMLPCSTDLCTQYSALRPYQYAVEYPVGRFNNLSEKSLSF